MKQKVLHIAAFALIGLFSFVVAPTKSVGGFRLENGKEFFRAGSAIALEFSTSSDEKPLLYCSYSYGNTLIEPEKNPKKLRYNLPKNLAKKSGSVQWKLLTKTSNLEGSFRILPEESPHNMECYLGPTTVDAGGNDFAFFVAIPTDAYDNPLASGTAVTTYLQFLESQIQTEITTKGIIAQQKITSKNATGRMLVSAESNGVYSNEFSLDVLAAVPTAFRISARRVHDYADGNQITTFTSSVIQDAHGNLVSDGTFVRFLIRDNKGNLLETTGTTLAGVAQAKIVHPEQAAEWTVRAVVEGICQSNTLQLGFRQAVKEIKVNFSKNKRTIRVGPLQSFMGQHIPDGLQVHISVYQNQKEMFTETKSSFEGKVRFSLEPDKIPAGIYDIRITSAGKEKFYPNLVLW